MSHELFVDTSALYPLVVRSHPDHTALASVLRERIANGTRIVTSNLVVAESHALIMRRAGIAVALRFVSLVRASPNIIVTATSRHEDNAINDWLSRFDDQQFSLTDAVSFVIMSERGMNHALTLDHHFTIAGFAMITGT